MPQHMQTFKKQAMPSCVYIYVSLPGAPCSSLLCIVTAASARQLQVGIACGVIVIECGIQGISQGSYYRFELMVYAEFPSPVQEIREL